MSQRLTSYRQGDRSEYLAQLILSALGLAVPVPRQEDVGIDFYCTLGQEVGDVTRFFEPFSVQVKSASEKTFVYGGSTNEGKLKLHEVAWLLNQQTPFFVAKVYKSAMKLDLFCTTTRWFAYHNPQVPYKLVFRPNTPAKNVDVHNGTKTSIAVALPPGVEAISWELPLGQPILSITAKQAEDRKVVASARNILRQYINIEVQNAVAAANRIQYFHWPLRISTNKPPQRYGMSVQWFTQPTPFTHTQLRTLTLLVASLLRTYEGINDDEKVTKLGALLDLLPQDPDLGLVRQVIQDGIKMQAAKTGAVTQEAVT
jgi:hypothetical protein